MPVAVPNNFYQRYNKYNNMRYNTNNYRIADNFYSNEIDNLIDENQQKSFYLVRLEQKIKRLENINNIFLDILREKTEFNNKRIYRNKSTNDISYGPYPYLSFDKNKNKELLYLNNEAINNNKILLPSYRNKYLLPLLPKYNSVSENNRMNYLLKNEKLKHFSEGSKPYFFYNNELDNIPQKINSVQYFNKKMNIEKYTNSTKNINDESNDEEKSKRKSGIIGSSKTSSKILNSTILRNEINKLNDNINKRLSKIENIQKTQKKDIDYLLNKSKENTKRESKSNKDKDNKENNSNNVNKKENNKNKDNKDNKDNEDNNDKENNNNKNKKEEKKDNTDESDDDEDEEEEEDDDDDDEGDKEE